MIIWRSFTNHFRRQVLGNQGAVERSTAAITRTERLAVETENIGNEITTELGNSWDGGRGNFI